MGLLILYFVSVVFALGHFVQLNDTSIDDPVVWFKAFIWPVVLIYWLGRLMATD